MSRVRGIAGLYNGQRQLHQGLVHDVTQSSPMRLSSPALRLAVGFAVAIGLTGCGSASEPEPPAGPTQAATVPLAATRADPVEDRLPPVIG